MSAADLLIEARDRILDPAHWLRGQYHDDSKDRFCAVGSIRESGQHFKAADYNKAIEMLYKAALEVGVCTEKHSSPICVNDHLGHEATMTMFDRSIRLAKEAEEGIA